MGPTGASSPTNRVLGFRFEGLASEYFKIWIVNVALTILTLGIYSAWAKVRTKNYFYKNTFLDGSSFEYTADPIKILKGRLIVGGMFVLASISQKFSSAVYAILILIFMLLMPALLALSAAFNARYSSFRNVAFHFDGRMGGVYKAIFVGGLIHILTLGLGFPVTQWILTRYFVGNHRYGTQPFRWDATIGQFYLVYLKSFLFLLPGLIAFGIALKMIAPQLQGGQPPDPSTWGPLLMAFVVFYFCALLSAGYVQAELANIVFGSVHVGRHRLRSDLQALPMIWIVFSNAVAVALSVGLLHPWAKVRMVRYRMEHLDLEQNGELMVDADLSSSRPGALGDAATDLGDFDFDFGF